MYNIHVEAFDSVGEKEMGPYMIFYIYIRLTFFLSSYLNLVDI